MTSKTKTMFRDLDRYRERIPLADLLDWHSQADCHYDDVRDYLRFHPDHYVRNLMHAGSAYQALVLCWRNGQRSPIHDHSGSSCALKIIRGVAWETLFDKAPNGMVVPMSSRELVAGSVTGSEDTDIHQMSNLSADDQDLITLHIYSPPLLHMNVFSITDPKVIRFFDPINDEFVDGAGI